MANDAELLNDIMQLLPTVFIEQITLDSIVNKLQSKKNLLVDVSLSLKDVVDKDGISQWFAQQDLQKYIKIHSLLITSESVYNELYNLPDKYGYNELKFIFTDNPVITEKILELPSHKDLIQTKGVFYSENYISDNDDGTQEITVPKRTKYEILFDEENDKFLAILTFLTFDLKAFASAFGITGIDEQNALSKSFTSQIIIKDGAVVSETQYFTLPDGSFYYGQFHAVPSLNPSTNLEEIEYRSGIIETENSQPLQLVTTTNNIISDFRVRKYFGDKTEFDAIGITNNLFKDSLQIKKIIDNNKVKPKEYSKYFSNTLVSLDENGSCRFSFFFDKQKYALDNCYYPIILDPSKNPSGIPEQVRVKNISVYRIRKDIKEINDSSENLAIFVASNSGVKTGLDILNNPDLNTFDGSYVVENNIEGIDHSILKNYSVCDASVSKINYGLYKYKVSMEIVDPTKEYLKDMLSKVVGPNGILSILQSYYTISLSNKRITTEIIGDVKDKQIKYVPYFDNLLGKFIPDFTKNFATEIQVAQNQLTNFLTLAKIAGYYSFNSVEEEQKMVNSINNLIVPPSATPESIQVVIELVKNFAQKIESLLEISDSEAASNASAKYKNNIITFDYIFENSFTNNLGYSTEYDSNKIYDNYFNATIINGAGFKVVNNLSTQDNLGINSIKLADYKKTTDAVSQKHFNDNTVMNIKDYYGDKVTNVYDFIDEFDNDDSKYSYLPISSIGTINKKYSFTKLSEQFSDQKYYENIFLDILNYNTIKLSKFGTQDIAKNSTLSQEEQAIKGQLLDLFSTPEFSNVSFAVAAPEALPTAKSKTPQQSLFNTFGSSGSVNIDSKIDVQKAQVLSTSISSQTDVSSDPSSLLLEILLHEIINNDNDLKNGRDFSIFAPVNEDGEKSNRFFMNQVISSYNKKASVDPNKLQTLVSNYIKALPLPIKHLIVSRGNISNVVKAYDDYKGIKDATIYPENFFKYWINFKKIYEVQYFDGFADGNIKSPQWRTLTINKLKSSQANILCRLQKYKLSSYEGHYPDIAKLEMPLFDQYFYIIPDNAVNLLTSIQKSIQSTPKIVLPPLELAKPAPDKVGPVSAIGLVSAVKTLQQISVQAPTLAAIASTISPISLKVSSAALNTSNITSNTNKPSLIAVTDTAASAKSLQNVAAIQNLSLQAAPTASASQQKVTTIEPSAPQIVVKVEPAHSLANISVLKNSAPIAPANTSKAIIPSSEKSAKSYKIRK